MPAPPRSTSSLVICANRRCNAFHLVVVTPGRPRTCSYCGCPARAHPLGRHRPRRSPSRSAARAVAQETP